MNATTSLSQVNKPSSCVIVVPCYNEEKRLPGNAFLDYVSEHSGVDFLFVNDGSQDNTLAILHSLRDSSAARCHVLNLSANVGKAEAVRAGMLAALTNNPHASFAGFWDADLATPLDAISDFLAEFSNNTALEIVLGSRVRLLGRQVKRSAMRHYVGRVFASLASSVLRLPVYDTQCGAKIFRVTPLLAEVLAKPFVSRWIFDVEILARYISLRQGDANALQDTVYEIPLKVWSDVAGSKVRPADALKAAADLYKIHQRYLRRQSLDGLTPRVRNETSSTVTLTNILL